ncbi:MAG TPA: hypothetical protein VNV66_17870 [Pilimelia sp.]|nr:hypothetical protein [Pilimelia sp.]
MRQILLPPRLDVAPSLDERCDRCGAAGKLSLRLVQGGRLVFCGHHANRHTEDILSRAAQVVVEDGFDWWGADRTVPSVG